MATIKLKVSRIGNSRGVRLPADVLKRYRIGDSVILEERSEGLLLRPDRHAETKLSWEDTAQAMAAAREDWSAWDRATSDGLIGIPWESSAVDRVAEAGGTYQARRRKPKP
jgi:antitoxin component of MazEF toxin-antitoxin module